MKPIFVLRYEPTNARVIVPSAIVIESNLLIEVASCESKGID